MYGDHQKHYHPKYRYSVNKQTNYDIRRSKRKFRNWCRKNNIEETYNQLWRIHTKICDLSRGLKWNKDHHRTLFRVQDFTPLKRGKIFINIIMIMKDKNNKTINTWANSFLLKQSGSLKGTSGGFRDYKDRELPNPYEY